MSYHYDYQRIANIPHKSLQHLSFCILHAFCLCQAALFLTLLIILVAQNRAQKNTPSEPTGSYTNGLGMVRSEATSWNLVIARL